MSAAPRDDDALKLLRRRYATIIRVRRRERDAPHADAIEFETFIVCLSMPYDADVQ
jgi:hypothetical protein